MSPALVVTGVALAALSGFLGVALRHRPALAQRTSCAALGRVQFQAALLVAALLALLLRLAVR